MSKVAPLKQGAREGEDREAIDAYGGSSVDSTRQRGVSEKGHPSDPASASLRISRDPPPSKVPSGSDDVYCHEDDDEEDDDDKDDEGELAPRLSLIPDVRKSVVNVAKDLVHLAVVNEGNDHKQGERGGDTSIEGPPSLVTGRKDKKSSVVLVRPVQMAYRLRVSDDQTVAVYIWGAGAGLNLIKLYKSLKGILQLFWMVGVLFTVMCLFSGHFNNDWNHELAVPSMVGLPSPLGALLMMNRSLLWELFQRFDTFYCISQLVTFVGCFCYLLGDVRVIALAGPLFFNILVIILADGLSPGGRHYQAKYGSIFGVIAMTMVSIMLYRGNTGVRPVSVTLGRMEVSLESLVIGSCINLNFFLVRNYINAMKSANSFGTLRCRMENKKSLTHIANIVVASSLLVSSDAAALKEAKAEEEEGRRHSNRNNDDTRRSSVLNASSISPTKADAIRKTTTHVVLASASAPGGEKSRRTSAAIMDSSIDGVKASNEARRGRQTTTPKSLRSSAGNDLVEVAKDLATYADDGSAGNSSGAVRTEFLVRPSECAIILDTEDTMGRLVFGSGGTAVVKYFRRPCVKYTALLSWVAGVVFALLAPVTSPLFPDRGNHYLAYASLIGCVNPLISMLSMNRVMVWKLLPRFETGYCVFHLLLFLGSVSYIMNDKRCLISLPILCSVLLIIYCDALSSSARKFTARTGMSVGVIALTTAWFILYLGLLGDEDTVFYAGEVKLSLVNIATNAVFNLDMFFLRNFVTVLLFEDSYAVMNSRLESIKVTKAVANIAIASSLLVCNEAAAVKAYAKEKKRHQLMKKKRQKAAAATSLEEKLPL